MDCKYSGSASVKRFFALAVCFFLTGCAAVNDAKPPSIRLSNLQIGTAGLLSQELLLDIRIGNPNNFSLPLNGLTFQLDVNGRPFAEGLSNEAIEVPRLGYASVSATGTADTLSILRQLLSISTSDRITYRLHGTAYLGGVGHNRAVPYDRRGEISLLPESGSDAKYGLRTFVPMIRQENHTTP